MSGSRAGRPAAAAHGGGGRSRSRRDARAAARSARRGQRDPACGRSDLSLAAPRRTDLREVEGERAAKGARAAAPALSRSAQRWTGCWSRSIAPIDLIAEQVARHRRRACRPLARKHPRCSLEVQARWLAELTERGEVDAAARRNLLFEHAARRWREQPPAHPIVAAGVTSASPALAQAAAGDRRIAARRGDPARSRSVAWMTRCGIELGSAGTPESRASRHSARDDAVTHPQYHLKLLLNRMGVARAEVQPWHRAGLAAAAPERSHAISSLFLPPRRQPRWVGPAGREAPPCRRAADGERQSGGRSAGDRDAGPPGAGGAGEARRAGHARSRACAARRRASAALEDRGRRYARAARCRKPRRAACCCCWPRSWPRTPRRCR